MGVRSSLPAPVEHPPAWTINIQLRFPSVFPRLEYMPLSGSEGGRTGAGHGHILGQRDLHRASPILVSLRRRKYEALRANWCRVDNARL